MDPAGIKLFVRETSRKFMRRHGRGQNKTRNKYKHTHSSHSPTRPPAPHPRLAHPLTCPTCSLNHVLSRPPPRPQDGSHTLLAGPASQRYPVQGATEPADWAASRRQLGCQCASPAGHSASKLASQLGQSSQGQPRPAQLVSRPAGQLASRPPNQPASQPTSRPVRQAARPPLLATSRAGEPSPRMLRTRAATQA